MDSSGRGISKTAIIVSIVAAIIVVSASAVYLLRVDSRPSEPLAETKTETKTETKIETTRETSIRTITETRTATTTDIKTETRTETKTEAKTLTREEPRKETRYFGDLVVTNTMLINHSTALLKGNLIVNGTGRLIVKDSDIHFTQDYNQQYKFIATSNAKIDFENVRLYTGGKWFNLNYYDNATVDFKNVSGEDCCLPWHSSSNNATFHISDSTIGLTMSENVNIHAERSKMFIELVLTNVTGTFRLPKGHVDHFTLNIKNSAASNIKLDISDSEFTSWGTTLDKHTNVTLVDTYITIGLNAGSDWKNNPSPTVKVSDLKAKNYSDYSLIYDTNRLRLVNTQVTSWYPQAWNNATVEISNSDLADVQFNGGTSTVIIRNSTASIAIAREKVTYRFYNSVIEQDVIAHDNSEIYLHNTTVKGQLIETGNGKIFIDGKRLVK